MKTIKEYHNDAEIELQNALAFNDSEGRRQAIARAAVYAELAKTADRVEIRVDDGVRDLNAVTGWAPGHSPRSTYGDEH